jgi:GT2 family glycosyltransferase
VESVIEGTDHPDFEVVVADNGSTSAETLDYLDALRRRPNCRVVAVPGEFNFPHIVNRAVAATRAAVVVLLNNDTEVLGPFWLRDLVRHAVRDGVGAVGARLLYPGGRVQHAGVVLGWGGYAGHFGRNQPEGSCDHLGRDLATHEVAAVTAACLAVSRAHFDAVGGFDESFAVDFNDVDFCLRLSRLGLRNLLCPSAVLRHHESASRRHEGARRARFEAERRRFGERWRSALGADPFFPLLLSLQRNDERLE